MLESALTQMKSAFRVEKMTAKRWQGLRDSRALVNPSLSGIEIKEGEDWTNEFHPQ
jgi:hypothetical protein